MEFPASYLITNNSSYNCGSWNLDKKNIGVFIIQSSTYYRIVIRICRFDILLKINDEKNNKKELEQKKAKEIL